MNTRFKSGDFVARHARPVWRDRADFIVAVNIASRTEKCEWEQLWAKKLDHGRIEICCVPFFAYGLALGDEVEIDEDNVVSRVTRRSGHTTFRVWIGDSEKQDIPQSVRDVMRHEHCAHEWSSENLIAISSPNQGGTKALVEVLEVAQQQGQLTYEIG